MSPLASLRDDAARLIARLADGRRDDEARDALLVRIAEAQADAIPVYGRLARHKRPEGSSFQTIEDVPALPTDVFRFARVASFAEGETTRTFLTSGTTHGARGAHHFADLSLYDLAARSAASRALFTGLDSPRLIVAAPHPDESPDSSLSYMLGRFERWFSRGRSTFILERGALRADRVVAALAEAADHGEPVVLAGTSFAFVHLDDALGDSRFALPPESRIMQTGGFKGRSRELSPESMRHMLSIRYRVPEPAIVAEYGMTELSSQLYETTILDPSGPRRYWVPGWLRASVVDPETLRPVRDGDVGILRIDDVANVDSVCAIQTADLARQAGDGIEVLGRASDAVPRGCGLAIDAALGDRAGS